MKQTIYVAAIALVFGCGPTPAASVKGTIVDDATGMPVAKSEVRVFGQRFPAIEGTTKDDGTFQADDLRSGDYTVSAWGPGYVPTATETHVGSEAVSLHLRLVRLGTIEGQLTGLQGWTAGVLALTKSVDKKTGNEIWKPVLGHYARSAAVDGEGRFRIPDLPPGVYSLLVAYSNSGVLRYPAGKETLELKGDGATARVQIPIPAGAARTVEGQIDLPETQSWYWVTLSDPTHPELAVATTISDDKGAFAFRGIVPGAYDVLAAPGEGEPGTPSATPPYHGFARVAVDLRARDVRGVKITPQQAIKVSVALQELNPMPRGGGCGSGSVRLMPLEDWGVRLERSHSVVIISNDGAPLSPESIDGMAPARYGVSVENVGECFIADNPVLDVTKVLAGNIEAKMREPGTVKGLADAGSEAILIPEDFAEGWSFLPAYWFDDLPFGAELHFSQQAIFRGGSPPHARITVADADGHFEFSGVPVGSYRIGLRTLGPAPDRQTMKQIDVPPAGIAEADLRSKPVAEQPPDK